MSGPFARALETIRAGTEAPLVVTGRVASIAGATLAVTGLPACVGAILRVERDGEPPVFAEVVGFQQGTCLAIPLASAAGIAPGARARVAQGVGGMPATDASRGRILDGLARPLDGAARPRRRPWTPGGEPPPVLERQRIEQPLDVGIRAINALQTIGRGSRIGIFAGSGVGKSTLLGQIARFCAADAIVVALVGERRREVREFVEGELGDALAQATVVVASSDDSPALRRRAGLMASELAQDLAREGRHVLFLMDSLSRFCTAQREIGLSAGEPPATRGYPPSVWSLLPQLVEQAGTLPGAGSVTGIYTILVEGDDPDDPIADAARSLLDGHIVLSRRIAESGRFPAIDPLASLSRVMHAVVDDEHQALARRARSLLSVLSDAEDLIRIGAYTRGNDRQLDEAMALEAGLRAFLAQGHDERSDLAATREQLRALLQGGRT